MIIGNYDFKKGENLRDFSYPISLYYDISDLLNRIVISVSSSLIGWNVVQKNPTIYPDLQICCENNIYAG
jgi:hypothetical protein